VFFSSSLWVSSLSSFLLLSRTKSQALLLCGKRERERERESPSRVASLLDTKKGGGGGGVVVVVVVVVVVARGDRKRAKNFIRIVFIIIYILAALRISL